MLFDGVEQQVVALAGTRVRLVAADGTPSVVLLDHLLASPGVAILGASKPAAPSLGSHLLDDVPVGVPEREARE